MRSEIDSVEGLSLGNTANFALLQSTYSVLSFPGDSQKARSVASFANLGIGFKRFLIDSPLFAARCPSRNRSNQRTVSTLGKGDEQAAIRISPTQRVKPRLLLAMFYVRRNDQWPVEKCLFNFSLGYTVLFVLP
jgi:hypothetical protein